MGAIQNTVNAALGTAAAVALGAEKMAQEKEALTESLPKVTEELTKGAEDIKGAEADLAKAQTGRNELGQFKTKDQTQKDIEMAQLALNTLQGKQEARKMQLERMQTRFKLLGGKING